MRLHYCLFLFLMTSIYLSAQDCRLLGAVDVFHANEIRTNVMQRGNAFWDYDDAVFQVPFSGKDSPSTIFNSAIWLGGKDGQGKIKVIAQEYGQHLGCGFMPGPLADVMPLDDDGVKNWNRNFQVTRFEIEQHRKDVLDGQIDEPLINIFGWPAKGNEYFESIHGFSLDLGPQGGAGFIEVEGHRNGRYEPDLGEYPHVRGLSELAKPVLISWNVYNSARDQMEIAEGDPLICEIQETTYAFNCDEDSEEADLLNHSLFQQFQLTSLSGDVFEDVKLGIWVDPDLGCYTDDYIGSSPENNTVYWYNEDNEDGSVGVECNSGVLSYGNNPPAMGLTFLNQDMSSLMYYDNNGFGGFPPSVDPQSAREYYQYLDATWRDGTRLTRGGTGYNVNSTDTVRHAFLDPPNDPQGWSMYSVGIGGGDRRIMAAADVGPFESGQSWSLDVVYHFNRLAGNGHIDNAILTIERSQWFNDDLLEGCAEWAACDCDCVWPGDADQNGAVTYKDAANVIFGLGKTGDQRSDPLPFAPREVANWDVSLFEGLDARFADVNGNGVIAEDDFELFQLYLGQTNACRIENPVECPEGTEVYFDFRKEDSTYTDGLNIGDLILSTKNDFVGVSYEIQVDESLLSVLDYNPRITWKDTSVKDLSIVNKIVDPLFSRIQCAQLNRQSADERLSLDDNNLVGRMILNHKDIPSSYHSPYVEVKICDFTVYYEDGSTERLPTKPQRYYLPDSVVVTALRSPTQNQIDVFPNPARNSVRVIGLEAPFFSYEWKSLDGRMVGSGLGRPSDEIEFTSSNRGIFILKIVANEKSYFQKVVFR